MSAVLFADAARWQLRSAVETIRRRDPAKAASFLDQVDHWVRNRTTIETEGRALPEAPDAPYREVRADGYRVFFRTEADTLWIAGVWRVAPETYV